MKKLLILLCAFIAISATAQKPTDKRLQGLDTFVNKVLKDWHAAGVSIAVVEKNKVVYVGGFGYRDVEKKLPVDENTLFAIGSCTKAFTSSMIGMLMKDGLVDIDKPVRNYLPDLKFYNEFLNDHVTLRDMMSHRTGLPRHDFSWYGSTATRLELLKRIEFQEPSAQLREKWQYNNFMFMAQGVLIEKLTGKSWENNLREKILTPLGMNNTVMSVVDMEKSSNRSRAYDVRNDTIHAIPFRNIDAIGPAGSINSSSKDMANWLLTWINGGKFNGKEIIPANYLYQAMTPQMVTGAGLPAGENKDVFFGTYGFAWGMSSYRGHYRVEHGGGIDGFITSTGFFPADSIGIFVVSSQSGPTTAIRNFIADRMLGLSYRNWSKQQLDAIAKEKLAATTVHNNPDSSNRKPNTKPSHDIKDYAGIFENPGYGQAKLFIEHDTLWLDYNEAGQRTKSYLQHYHYDVFRIRSTEEVEEATESQKIKFNIDNKGDIISFETAMEAGVKDIVFSKLPPSIKVTKESLEKYVGEYQLPGAIAKVYIRGENTLMVLVPGQPDYELVPTKLHEFDFKILKGFSVKFDVNDKNESTQLSFIQPNGTFKAKRKL